MYIELYIMFMVFLVIAIGAAIWSQNPLVWSFVIVLAGFMVFNSFSIEYTSNVVSQSNTTLFNTTYVNTYSYTDHTTYQKNLSLVYLNIAVGALAILMFFYELFDMWKNYKIAKEEE